MLDWKRLKHPDYAHSYIAIPIGSHLISPDDEYFGKWQADSTNAYMVERIDYNKSFEHSGYYVLYFTFEYNDSLDLAYFKERCVNDGKGIPSRGQEVLW